MLSPFESHLRRRCIGDETRSVIFTWIRQTEDELRSIADGNGDAVRTMVARTRRAETGDGCQRLGVELSIFDLWKSLN